MREKREEEAAVRQSGSQERRGKERKEERKVEGRQRK